MKLTCACIAMASYARMIELRFGNAILTPDDARDLNRICAWYNALGQDMKDKIDMWIKEFSKETHDVTQNSGRSVGKRAFKWGPGQ